MATEMAEIVRIQLEKDESGLIFATSGDLPGLFLAHRDLSAMKTDIPNVIRLLYQRRYNVSVEIVEANAQSEPDAPNLLGIWIAIPPHVIAANLSS